jgi:catalase
VHSKGILLTGTFTPTAEASRLSIAPHFQATSTPVIARFSDFTGLPNIPDNDDNAKPNGLAIRFNLGTDERGRRRHTDIIGHSTPHFPASSGYEFAEFLAAVAGGDATIGPFLQSHEAAARLVFAPKPFAKSYAEQEYYALHTFGLEGKDGKTTWVKYTIVPVAGSRTISDDEAKRKGPQYLHDEIVARVKAGSPIELKIVATLAKDGDTLNDVTAEWPADRETVELGFVKLKALVEKDAEEQKYAIFDPVPRVKGVKEADGDQVMEFRAALYLLSGKERRAA